MSGLATKRILLSLVLILAGVAQAPVEGFAQSLLSDRPAWEDGKPDDSGWDEAARENKKQGDGLFSWLTGGKKESEKGGAENLGDLYRQVQEGNGRKVFNILLDYQKQIETDAGTESPEKEKLNPDLLVNLLKAGQGWNDPEMQVRYARLFVEHFPDHDQFPFVFFYLNDNLERLGRPIEESFFFDEGALAVLPDWMRTRYLRMRAQQALRHGVTTVAVQSLMEEMKGKKTLQITKESEVLDALGQVGSLKELDTLLEAYGGESWIAERVPMLRIRAGINEGSFQEALLAIDQMQREDDGGSPEQIKFLHDAKNELRRRVLTIPGRLGVLLPLSSSSRTLRQLAQETLDGLRMAVQFHNTSRKSQAFRLVNSASIQIDPFQDRPGNGNGQESGKGSLELVIRDTGNNPDQAAEMVEKLVLEDNVFAIIGPLARNESIEAAMKAETLRVPLISLSLTLDIPTGFKYVFRHSKSQEEEIRDLVRYAIDYAGAKRFAILYPEGAFGRQIANLFWTEVVSRGGRIVGYENYETWRGSPDKTGLSVGLKAVFDRLAGMDRPLDAIDRELQEKVGDSNPDPIVDFDALFIPVGPNGSDDLRLIAPYPVTVDAEKVLLLGNRFWNDNGVLVAGDGKLEGSIFVDVYNRRSRRPEMKKFLNDHLMLFGHRTSYRRPTFFTALGYDTIGILKSLMMDDKNRNSAELARKLTTMKPYDGITGLTGFLETGEAVKESMFFTINRDRFVRITP